VDECKSLTAGLIDDERWGMFQDKMGNVDGEIERQGVFDAGSLYAACL